jgi:hypothetical protein
MIEIAPSKFIPIKKILGMKIVNKEDKFWVVFTLDSEHKEEKSAFSEAHASLESAKNFLDNVAQIMSR